MVKYGEGTGGIKSILIFLAMLFLVKFVYEVIKPFTGSWINLANNPLYVVSIIIWPLLVLIGLTFKKANGVDKIIVTLASVAIIIIVVYWEVWFRSIEKTDFFETSLTNKGGAITIAVAMMAWVFRKGIKY
jgi:hypothetical protein